MLDAAMLLIEGTSWDRVQDSGVIVGQISWRMVAAVALDKAPTVASLLRLMYRVQALPCFRMVTLHSD